LDDPYRQTRIVILGSDGNGRATWVPGVDGHLLEVRGGSAEGSQPTQGYIAGFFGVTHHSCSVASLLLFAPPAFEYLGIRSPRDEIRLFKILPQGDCNTNGDRP